MDLFNGGTWSYVALASLGVGLVAFVATTVALVAEKRSWAAFVMAGALALAAVAVAGLVVAYVGGIVAHSGGSHKESMTATVSGFCSTHRCIPDFNEGQGSIVQCADGTWSHSGGLQGACSYHGGERGY